MNSMISILLGVIFSSLTEEVYRNIAIEILASYTKLQTITQKDLAKKCNVSTTTLNKFYAYIGCRSYNDMKRHIKDGESIRRAQIELRLKKTDEKKVLDNISALAQTSFNRSLFIRSIEEFNELAHEASQIIILGGNFPQALSLHYQQDMILFGKMTYAYPSVSSIVIPKVDEKTLFVLISQSGNTLNFAKDKVQELMNTYHHVSVITGNVNIEKDESVKNIIRIPIEGEDETGNTLLVEIFRYMKFKYHQKYCR